MKRIALVSVHNDPNYGSALQAYALAYAIKREGYECEYLNYTPAPSHNSLKTRVKAVVKSLLIKIGILKEAKSEYSYWRTPEFKCQKQLFEDFHEKRIPCSSRFYDPTTIKEANRQYDCFLVGSDQTWSPYVTIQKNNINFLDFVEAGKIKGSYAPSLGTCNLKEEYVEKLKEKISDFAFLSCREKQNAEFLSNCLGRKVHHVLDPTLLLNREEWLQVSESIKMPEKYILCYVLGTKQRIASYAENLSIKESIPVYFIVSRPEYLSKTNALNNVTPGQFITLISNASYVITDSFHGSLFSINFQRQFYVFTKREESSKTNDNDRIGDLLSILGLSDRLIKDSYDIKNREISYKDVYRKVDIFRQSSLSYLSNMLCKAQNEF